MINKVFELLYNKIFVNIIVKKHTTIVYMEQSSKDKIIDSIEKEFDTISVSESMQTFIESYISESPFYYISVLDDSRFQGALPACSRKRLEFYKHMDADEVICVKERWSAYTPRDDLYIIEKKYKDIGIDFIFSPFIILSNIFKDKLDIQIAMFVLIEEDKLSLSIFSDSQLLFSEYVSIGAVEEDALIEEDSADDDFMNDDFGLDDASGLDELDELNDIEELDDFADIEDLDSLDDISDFDDSKDIEEEFRNLKEDDFEEEEEKPLSPDSFKEDYQRFFAIQNVVNNFYSDEKYESEFIENVYIADTVGVSDDLKRYLEEEMFLSVYIRDIKLPVALCDIAKMELKL